MQNESTMGTTSSRRTDRDPPSVRAGSRDTTVTVIPQEPQDLSWQLVAHTAGALTLPQVHVAHQAPLQDVYCSQTCLSLSFTPGVSWVTSPVASPNIPRHQSAAGWL